MELIQCRTGTARRLRPISLILACLFACGASSLAASEPKLRDTLHPHKQRVTYIVFSPDGKMLASTSGDFTTVLCDLTTGKSSSIKQIIYPGAEFSADGKTLVLPSATRDPHQGDGRAKNPYPAILAWDMAGQVSKSG